MCLHSMLCLWEPFLVIDRYLKNKCCFEIDPYLKRGNLKSLPEHHSIVCLSLIIVTEVKQKQHTSLTCVLQKPYPFLPRWFLKTFWTTRGSYHWQAEIILKPWAKCQNSNQPNTTHLLTQTQLQIYSLFRSYWAISKTTKHRLWNGLIPLAVHN